MGSERDARKKGAELNEMPAHEVTFEEPFYIGKYEVTQEQWFRVMGDLPPMVMHGFDPRLLRGPKKPVVCVNWNDCQKFIKKLTLMTRCTFSLPSEAEWEYACRAGTTWEFCFGDDEKGLGAFAWYSENANIMTHPVGQKAPNAWGLYDMHGSVWEWCDDPYHPNYNGAPADGAVWKAGGWATFAIMRGGCWESYARGCRARLRLRQNKGYAAHQVGLRIVLRELEETEE